MVCSILRQFYIPILNFGVTEYINIIDCQICKITLSHILNREEYQEKSWKLSEKRLKEFFHLSKFLFHIQGFEKCLKLVTGVSFAAIAGEARNAYM